MPTIRVYFPDPRIGGGYQGAWLAEGFLTVAQQATLLEVLAAVDPDLEVASGDATVAIAGEESVVTRSAIAGDRLRGLVLSSDRMVKWTLTITGRDPIVLRTEVGAPAQHVILPGSIALTAGDDVEVLAANESDQGAASCSAAVLWRNDA